MTRKFIEITEIARELASKTEFNEKCKMEYLTEDAKALHEKLINLLTPFAKMRSRKFASACKMKLDRDILTEMVLYEATINAIKFWDYEKFPDHFMNSLSLQISNEFKNYIRDEFTDKRGTIQHSNSYEVRDGVGKKTDLLNTLASYNNVEAEVEAKELLNYIINNVNTKERNIIKLLVAGDKPLNSNNQYGNYERIQVSRLKKKVTRMIMI